MNKRQKKKLRKRFGIFHYRELQTLYREFLNAIYNVWRDRTMRCMRTPAMNADVLRHMWISFIRWRKYGAPPFSYQRFGFAVHLKSPQDMDVSEVFGIPKIMATQRVECEYEPIKCGIREFDGELAPYSHSIDGNTYYTDPNTGETKIVPYTEMLQYMIEQDRKRANDAVKRIGKEIDDVLSDKSISPYDRLLKYHRIARGGISDD